MRESPSESRQTAHMMGSDGMETVPEPSLPARKDDQVTIPAQPGALIRRSSVYQDTFGFSCSCSIAARSRPF